jgi:Protein of unknown function (DUF1592)/Protein of unknown function (DUF1588)/Protein of unknown function (DUF1595)/Protein of unknown function (DUF1587)/Protein of unknown function (DUF1585)/Cellulose binding domain
MKRYLGFALATIVLLCSAGYGCLGGSPTKGSSSGEGGSGVGPTPGVGSCPDDLTFFENNIWNPILTVQCLGCHNASGPANGTRMVFLQPTQANYLAENLLKAKKMAGIASGGTSLLLLKPSGQVAHVGGTLFANTSPSYAAFELFVDRSNGVSGACGKSLDCSGGTLVPGVRALRRLSTSEYDNTVTDLLGLATPSTNGSKFPTDSIVNNFDNNAAALIVSPLLASDLSTAAAALAQTFVMTPGTLIPCDPTTDGADACAVTFIQQFGLRAFRRPLTQTEVVNYKTLYNLAANSATCDIPFNDGIQLVVTAMLQSPNFLYRTELGLSGSNGDYTLTPYEVASELSYLIWGSMPDATLFAAAAAGQLSTPAQIGAQASRLLQSPKARAPLDHFVAQWLDITSITTTPKDPTVYPNFTATLPADMLAETTQTVEHAVFDSGGSFTDLFTSRTSYMSSALAAFYGFPTSGSPDPTTGLYQVTRPAEEGSQPAQFSGVLTHGSVLAVHAKAFASSPILRGKMIREQILCQNLPPPPAGVNASPPNPTPGFTTRQLYAQHAEYQPCESCHTLIDPIGFGYENFDGVGVYRTTETAATADGGVGPAEPIDSSATIVSTESLNGNYAGSATMGAAFAQSPEIQQCFALQWFRYAFGVDETATLQCTVQKLAKDFAGDNLAIGQLIIDLTQQPHFTSRLTDGVAGKGDPAPDTGGTPPTSTPPAPNPIQVAMTSSMGQAGVWYVNVTVTNSGAAAVTWTLPLTLNGTISGLTNAVTSVSGTTVTFSGVSFNATLQPKAQAMFNFVLTGSQPLPPTQCGG